MIVWLKVPFAEKDQAKALGARWNPAQKKWYVKDVADLSPFEAWMTEQPAPAINRCAHVGRGHLLRWRMPWQPGRSGGMGRVDPDA